MRLSTLVLAVALVGGCKKTSGPTAAKDDMALVPKETSIVLMANVKRVRDSGLWKRALELRDSDPQAKKDYEEFVRKCGLDPFKQIDSVFLAFPANSGEQKEFTAILRGAFNEKQLVDCARDQAKRDGRELSSVDFAGKKIYSDSKGEAYVSFLDGATAVIGGKEWVKKTLELAANKTAESAKNNGELAALIKRAHLSEGLWGAGIVSQATRDQFKNDARLASAASMKDVFGSVDFKSGVAADLNVDTGGEADAKDLAAKATAQLAEVRKSPQLMMMGLAQYLDGIKVDSQGATFRLKVQYNQQQVDDLINRVRGLIKSFGNGLNSLPQPPPNQ